MEADALVWALGLPAAVRIVGRLSALVLARWAMRNGYDYHDGRLSLIAPRTPNSNIESMGDRPSLSKTQKKGIPAGERRPTAPADAPPGRERPIGRLT